MGKKGIGNGNSNSSANLKKDALEQKHDDPKQTGKKAVATKLIAEPIEQEQKNISATNEADGRSKDRETHKRDNSTDEEQFSSQSVSSDNENGSRKNSPAALIPGSVSTAEGLEDFNLDGGSSFDQIEKSEHDQRTSPDGISLDDNWESNFENKEFVKTSTSAVLPILKTGVTGHDQELPTTNSDDNLNSSSSSPHTVQTSTASTSIASTEGTSSKTDTINHPVNHLRPPVKTNIKQLSNQELLAKAKELSPAPKDMPISPSESMAELDSDIDLMTDVEFYSAESEPYLQELSLRVSKIVKNLSATTIYPIQHQAILQEHQVFLFDYYFLSANFSIDFPQSFYQAIKFAATHEQTSALIKLMSINSGTISEEHTKLLEAKHEYFMWKTLEKDEEKKVGRQHFESKNTPLDLARQFYLAKLYLDSTDLSLKDRQDTATKIFKKITTNDCAIDLDDYQGHAYEELALLIENDPKKIAEWAKLNRLAVEHGIVPARQKLYTQREKTENENSFAFGDIVLETDKIDEHLAHERKAKLKQAADGVSQEQNALRPSHPEACYVYAMRCAEDGDATETFIYMQKAVAAKYTPAIQQWTEYMSLAALSADLNALVAPTSPYYIKHNSDTDMYGTRKNGLALIRHQQFIELKKQVASLVNPENDEQAIAMILNDLVILVGKMLGNQTKPDTQKQARSNSFSDQVTEQVMSTLIQFQGSGTKLTSGSKTGNAILQILNKRLPWLFINHQLKPLVGFEAPETQQETFSSKAGSVVGNIASFMWSTVPNAITTVFEAIIPRPSEHEKPVKASFGYYLEKLDRSEVQEACLQNFAKEVKNMPKIDSQKRVVSDMKQTS